MNPTDVLEVAREAVIVMLIVGAPLLVPALVVGLIIALVQALTQVQEMTLTFVPKIIIMFLVLIVSLPFLLSTMIGFGESMMDRIVALG